MSEKKIILIMGIRGTGKTTKAKEIISRQKRLLIYDTLNEYNEGLIITNLNTLCNVWKKVYDKNFKLIYQPVSPVEDFGYVCELVFKCGNLTFMIEEIDTFLSLSHSALDFNFLNIVQRGRHNNIELIGITQRPYTLPAILRSQCKRLITFKQFEQRDIDWLKGLLGDSADEVKNLEQFEYMDWNDGVLVRQKTQEIKKLDKI